MLAYRLHLSAQNASSPKIAQNPFNPFTDTHDVRHRETYKVQRAHTETYKKSSVPFLQWKLNKQYKQITEQLSWAE